MSQSNRVVGEAGGANRWIRDEVREVMKHEVLGSMNEALRFLLRPYFGEGDYSIREAIKTLKAQKSLGSVNEVLHFLLLHWGGFVPLHKRPISELQNMLELEPSNKLLRSALLAARAGVE